MLFNVFRLAHVSPLWKILFYFFRYWFTKNKRSLSDNDVGELSWWLTKQQHILLDNFLNNKTSVFIHVRNEKEAKKETYFYKICMYTLWVN